MSAPLSWPEARSSDDCPSALDLDRFTVVGRPRAHALSRHLGACEGCRARLEEMDRGGAGLGVEAMARHRAALIDLAARPVGLTARWRAWLESPGRWRLAVSGAALAVLIAWVGAGAIAPLGRAPGQEGVYDGLKASGPVVLQLRHADGALRDGGEVRSGAIVDYRVSVARAGYVAVVALDDEGVVSRLLPPLGRAAVKVDAGVVTGRGGVDRLRGPERVFALFSDAPFDLDEVARRLRGAQEQVGGVVPLERLPMALQQDSRWFFKPGGER
jgi:hypothetical protein